MEFAVGDAATMANVADIHASLLAQVDQHDVALDLWAIARVDASFVQLIEAARRHAAAAGHTLTLSHPVNPALAAVLEGIGITAEDPESGSFWFGAPQTRTETAR